MSEHHPKDTLRAAAAAYLRRGFLPIPLGLGSKAPVTRGWRHLRPTADRLGELFPSGTGNIGLLLGAPSGGLIDVDLDCAEAIRAAPQLLPPTAWISGRAGRPRSHWWYLVAEPPRRAAESFHDVGGPDAGLVELRSTGGQTVVPPSVHSSGEALVWYQAEGPTIVDLAELRQAVAAVAACALLARHWPGRGIRQELFLALTGGLLRGGWDEGRVRQFVAALAAASSDEEASKRLDVVPDTAHKQQQQAPTTGWPRVAELLGASGAAVVQRARAWLGLLPGPMPGAAPPLRLVRPLPPYQDFPVEALPATLAEYVRQAAAALGCDPAYPALPALAAVASAIGASRSVRLKRGWDEPCVVWSLIVGDSGSLKSPAFARAVSPLFRLQQRLLLEFHQADDEYRRDLEAAKDAARAAGAPPVLRRVVCCDTTIEKLAEVLADNPRGILVARDELAAWLGSFTRYKSGKGSSDLPNWLEMHRAGTLLVDRKTSDRPTLFVRGAAVSLTGSIQPVVLARALTQEFLDAGLGARLLMAMPPRRAKRWSDVEVAPEVEHAYHHLLEALLRLTGQEDESGPAPAIVPLDPAARHDWQAFYDTWAKEQLTVDGELAAAFSKLEGYAARLALLHHVVSHVAEGRDDLTPLGPESLAAGVTLCRWFAGEAQRIYAALGESPGDRDTRHLLEYIAARGGRLSARELMRFNCRCYTSTEMATTALEGLVQRGLARWLPPSRRGGSATRAIELCEPVDPQHTDGPDDSDDMHDSADSADSAETTAASTVGSVSTVSTVMQPTQPAGPAWRLVTDAGALDAVCRGIADSSRVALHLETTGSDARRGRLGALWLAVDTVEAGTFVFGVDCTAVDPAPLGAALAESAVVMHDAAAGLPFLAARGLPPPRSVHDTLLLAQLLTAGSGQPTDLVACCRHWLGDGEPSAARLAALLRPLRTALGRAIEQAGLRAAAELEESALPAIVWLAAQGVQIDRDGWLALAREAQVEAGRLRESLDAAASLPPGFVLAAWNWDSPEQVQEALRLAGCPVADTRDATLASVEHPLAQLVRQYRRAQRRLQAFGPDWLEHVGDGGRVRAAWQAIGAATGRMSCASPNLQQLPRGPHRRCVVAAPGRRFAIADYSQIELRIAARLTEDVALREVYQRGDDLHVRTAQQVLGTAEVSSEQRQLAKALNFGLLYGMGALGLVEYARSQFGVTLTLEEARRHREAFFRSYPGLARWHEQTRSSKASEVWTLGRRRLLLPAGTAYTLRLNAPVQGTAADGLKRALALLWQRRDEVPMAAPVLAVHDEIVVECPKGQAKRVAAWLHRAMLDAMAPLLAPIPVVVEVRIAPQW
jgi:DNA polymerase-1